MSWLQASVVDPSTLNLDSDPGFGPNLFMLSIWKEKIKNDFWEKQFPLKKGVFFLTISTKWHLKNSLVCWVSELWICILNLKSYTFCLYFILNLHVRIRIINSPGLWSVQYSDQSRIVNSPVLWSVHNSAQSRIINSPGLWSVQYSEQSRIINSSGLLPVQSYDQFNTLISPGLLTVQGCNQFNTRNSPGSVQGCD